ncbi:MAG: helix-turn-helix transcriptional regulator [Chthoniobacterales bacterium]|nr:helix-turn-helix transcriptional regulator [Chthoniobacterales bacterium]
MGRSTLAIRNLLKPFHYIEEWYLTIPPGQSLKVPSDEFKLVFFLEGEVALSVPHHPELHLSKGDAFSLSFSTTQTYRSLRPERHMRLHFLRLTFRWPLSKTPPGKMPKGRDRGKRFEIVLQQRLTGFQHFPHSLFGDHYQLSRRILAEMEHADEIAAWKISGLCQTLTAGLLSPAQERRNGKPSLPWHRGGAAVEHALQYLQENCHETLTLTTIAWQVQLSGEHLARIFKQHTGKTVFEWLDHFRTERARNLLVTTEWPLDQIARASGYSSANLLSRHFKNNTGHTPTKFRIKSQKREAFSPSQFSV